MRTEIAKLRSFEVAGRAVKESESLSGQGAEVAKLQSFREGCQKNLRAEIAKLRSFEVAGRAVKKI